MSSSSASLILQNFKSPFSLSTFDSEHGTGLKTNEMIKRGVFVIEYGGELISWSEAEMREGIREDDESIGCYMFYCQSGRKKIWYLIQLLKINRRYA
jgi:hypothetical protein